MRSGGSIQLARVFGIRVGATPSWFFVLFLLIYLLTGYFGDVLSGSDSQALLTAVAAAVLFEVSIVVHEIGHAVVARRYDIGIAGIDLWFFGGLAKLEREPDTPGREFAVAIAGPVVTALVVGACVGISALTGTESSFIHSATLTDDTRTPGTALLGWLATVNVFLFAFNMIPAYPLDGGRIAKAIAWKVTGDRNRGLRAAARVGLGFAYLLIGLGVFLLFSGDGFDGIWFAVLGWFMAQSARGAVVASSFHERIEGVTVGDLMDPHPVTMPGTTTVLDAREAWFDRYRWPWFAVVDEDGRYRGVLDEAAIDEALAAGRPALGVAEVLQDGAGDDFRIDERAPLESLLASEPLRRLGALMVVDAEGRLRGVVTVEQVRRAVSAAASG
jgi:Zn-dependent protease